MKKYKVTGTNEFGRKETVLTETSYDALLWYFWLTDAVIEDRRATVDA